MMPANTSDATAIDDHKAPQVCRVVANDSNHAREMPNPTAIVRY